MEKSFLHTQAELSKFRDPRQEDDHRIENTVPITGYVKDRFDPEHPDADWGGFVDRTFKKRYFKHSLSSRDVSKYNFRYF